MATLNDTLEKELTQEHERYVSGSESLNIPTSLRRVPWMYHISTSENISFHPTTYKEDFSTAPLDDAIWLEDPVPDRHLYIHEQLQLHYQCSYPCPYRLDLPHSSPEDATAPYYEMMDLSDIWDIQDVMTTTSDEDNPDLEDIFVL